MTRTPRARASPAGMVTGPEGAPPTTRPRPGLCVRGKKKYVCALLLSVVINMVCVRSGTRGKKKTGKREGLRLRESGAC